jgi:hypothetical protein
MLLIDGARYELWTPEKEVEEFHPIVKEHIKDIFGENSIFIEPNKLISDAGKGSIPDGFVITFGEKPEWHIIEIELSNHDIYKHIIDQVGRFINGIGSTNTQRKIIDAIYQEVSRNKVRKAEFEEYVGSNEIYKFLNDLISKPPTLTIIIEMKTSGLDEALNLLRYSPIKIVEFQTFKSNNNRLIHAHLFTPIYTTERTPDPGGGGKKGNMGRITIKDLIESGLLRSGQIIFRDYKDTKYEGKILANGYIEINNQKFSSINLASKYVIDRPTGTENAWISWKIKREDGSECILDVLRKELLKKH